MQENVNETFREAEEPKKKRPFVFWAASIGLILIGIGLFWWFSQRPSQGMITVMSPPESIEMNDQEQRKRYQGKYFTFSYPSGFRRREEVEAVKYPLLERVYLSRNDIEGRKIAVVLQDNANNTFEEYSSFRIRRNDSVTYSEDRSMRNGLDTVFFTKTESVFEVGAFFHRGSRVASIVVSSPTTQNGLREEVESVIDSWQWVGE